MGGYNLLSLTFLQAFQRFHKVQSDFFVQTYLPILPFSILCVSTLQLYCPCCLGMRLPFLPIYDSITISSIIITSTNVEPQLSQQLNQASAFYFVLQALYYLHCGHNHHCAIIVQVKNAVVFLLLGYPCSLTTIVKLYRLIS